MLKHEDKNFKIYFGDKQDKIFKEKLMLQAKEKNILELENFENLKNFMLPENIFFLNQVHGTDGLVIKSESCWGKDLQKSGDFSEEIFSENILQEALGRSFSIDGDFLVTNKKNFAIGVLTADCLPIAFYDKKNNVIAVAHAGWRGSAMGIAIKTLESMQKNFGTNISDIQIFFGPCIKSCCYKVKLDFIQQFKQLFQENYLCENLRENLCDKFSDNKFINNVFINKNESLYFNLPEFNAILLENYEVKREAISFEYNFCTHCNNEFFSYRRGDLDGRQVSILRLLK